MVYLYIYIYIFPLIINTIDTYHDTYHFAATSAGTSLRSKRNFKSALPLFRAAACCSSVSTIGGMAANAAPSCEPPSAGAPYQNPCSQDAVPMQSNSPPRCDLGDRGATPLSTCLWAPQDFTAATTRSATRFFRSARLKIPAVSLDPVSYCTSPT